jgi:hypothetical protein
MTAKSVPLASAPESLHPEKFKPPSENFWSKTD